MSPEEAFKWFQKTQFLSSPPYFLSHWKTGKKFFYAEGALLAYEETRSHLVVAGEAAFKEGADKKSVYDLFGVFAKNKNKKLCGYYVGEKWKNEGFYKIQVGTSSSVCLKTFDLTAPCAKEIRRSLRKGEDLEYSVKAIPIEERGGSNVDELFAKWKKSKPLLTLKFFLSSPQKNGETAFLEKWITVEKGGETLAFCSLLPYFQEGELSYYVDNIVHNPQKDFHALSFLISSLILSLKAEGVGSLNLGLNPFAKIEGVGMLKNLFRLLYKSPVLYKPRGLHFFKSKFSNLEQEEFCFFQSKRGSLLGLLNMARVTL